MGTTTISVREETLERFNDLRDELNESSDEPDLTHDEFVWELLDEHEQEHRLDGAEPAEQPASAEWEGESYDG